MKKDRIRGIINIFALGLLFTYITGIGIVFIRLNLDDEQEFWFIIDYILWGGVSLLISVLMLMLSKLILLRG